MATPQNFRTAFNGFNREDVVHYIEYLNSKHTAEINQLNSELEFLRSKSVQEAKPEETDPIIDRIQELSDLNKAQEEELAALRAQKEALENQLSEAMTAGTEIEAQLNAALAESSRLSAELEAARQLKSAQESRAEEELEAYRRAERTERLARERAQQMYRQANGVIADATVKVDDAAARIGQLSESVLAQLAELQSAVAGSKNALTEAAATMYSIRPQTEE